MSSMKIAVPPVLNKMLVSLLVHIAAKRGCLEFVEMDDHWNVRFLESDKCPQWAINAIKREYAWHSSNIVDICKADFVGYLDNSNLLDEEEVYTPVRLLARKTA